MQEKPDFQELLDRKEDLCQELQDCLETDGRLPMLRHPLVYHVPYSSVFNALANYQLREKREALAETRKAKDWRRFIYLWERPYRLQNLATLKPSGFPSPKSYWELVGEILVDTENAWQCQQDIRKLLKCKLPGRDAIMEPFERKALAKLPEIVRVYRGHNGMNPNGFSWSLSHWWAGWFANRYATRAHEQVISTGWVRKEDVAALFLRRNEMEVLALPESVRDVTIWQEPDRAGLYAAAWGIAAMRSKLPESSPHS